ncbi:hypothetical protein [Symbiopectobacterium purcellii]|uniref:hypothetical protein n=1 Tax=Symbiopectobacterium purcellii TaxID=2871826 RepID=UPI003F8488C9
MMNNKVIHTHTVRNSYPAVRVLKRNVKCKTLKNVRQSNKIYRASGGKFKGKIGLIKQMTQDPALCIKKDFMGVRNNANRNEVLNQNVEAPKSCPEDAVGINNFLDSLPNSMVFSEKMEQDAIEFWKSKNDIKGFGDFLSVLSASGSNNQAIQKVKLALVLTQKLHDSYAENDTSNIDAIKKDVKFLVDNVNEYKLGFNSPIAGSSRKGFKALKSFDQFMDRISNQAELKGLDYNKEIHIMVMNEIKSLPDSHLRDVLHKEWENGPFRESIRVFEKMENVINSRSGFLRADALFSHQPIKLDLFKDYLKREGGPKKNDDTKEVPVKKEADAGTGIKSDGVHSRDKNVSNPNSHLTAGENPVSDRGANQALHAAPFARQRAQFATTLSKAKSNAALVQSSEPRSQEGGRPSIEPYIGPNRTGRTGAAEFKRYWHKTIAETDTLAGRREPLPGRDEKELLVRLNPAGGENPGERDGSKGNVKANNVFETQPHSHLTAGENPVSDRGANQALHAAPFARQRAQFATTLSKAKSNAALVQSSEPRSQEGGRPSIEPYIGPNRTGRTGAAEFKRYWHKTIAETDTLAGRREPLPGRDEKELLVRLNPAGGENPGERDGSKGNVKANNVFETQPHSHLTAGENPVSDRGANQALHAAPFARQRAQFATTLSKAKSNAALVQSSEPRSQEGGRPSIEPYIGPNRTGRTGAAEFKRYWHKTIAETDTLTGRREPLPGRDEKELLARLNPAGGENPGERDGSKGNVKANNVFETQPHSHLTAGENPVSDRGANQALHAAPFARQRAQFATTLSKAKSNAALVQSSEPRSQEGGRPSIEPYIGPNRTGRTGAAEFKRYWHKTIAETDTLAGRREPLPGRDEKELLARLNPAGGENPGERDGSKGNVKANNVFETQPQKATTTPAQAMRQQPLSMDAAGISAQKSNIYMGPHRTGRTGAVDFKKYASNSDVSTVGNVLNGSGSIGRDVEPLAKAVSSSTIERRAVDKKDAVTPVTRGVEHSARVSQHKARVEPETSKVETTDDVLRADSASTAREPSLANRHQVASSGENKTVTATGYAPYKGPFWTGRQGATAKQSYINTDGVTKK